MDEEEDSRNRRLSIAACRNQLDSSWRVGRLTSSPLSTRLEPLLRSPLLSHGLSLLEQTNIPHQFAENGSRESIVDIETVVDGGSKETSAEGEGEFGEMEVVFFGRRFRSGEKVGEMSDQHSNDLSDMSAPY